MMSLVSPEFNFNFKFTSTHCQNTIFFSSLAIYIVKLIYRGIEGIRTVGLNVEKNKLGLLKCSSL